MSVIQTRGISCLLLEDDPAALDFIKETLKINYPDLDIFPCKNLAEADLSFKQQQQTLFILDVNLPDGNCFDWLKATTEETTVKFSVIFITAFAAYAVQAFRFSAIDFLLKPYLPADLIIAVDKALGNMNDSQYHKQLETFFHNHNQQAKQAKKIVLKTLEEIFVIQIADILALEADNSYTRFRLQNGACILVSQPIKEYDNQLTPLGFMRVHQSYLINLQYIRTFKKKNNFLVLEGDLEIPVSQHKKIGLMTYLNNL
ncbi:two-component system LytT family response regulator [Pedobacter cryoconitis]|uniref:Two-component system LytT family response regulator n=1 Tax=Pedobacter cryoconitis TaxID=188932 RepID=A0A7W9DKI7_9SPHI|nr:LytTR family DNA-binding domain-containing protein [Pedobacter cryoconitis]MBB5621894.1 two-component system LytT family response regulator [Pedobacter cryoconitis]